MGNEVPSEKGETIYCANCNTSFEGISDWDQLDHVTVDGRDAYDFDDGSYFRFQGYSNYYCYDCTPSKIRRKKDEEHEKEMQRLRDQVAAQQRQRDIDREEQRKRDKKRRDEIAKLKKDREDGRKREEQRQREIAKLKKKQEELKKKQEEAEKRRKKEKKDQEKREKEQKRRHKQKLKQSYIQQQQSLQSQLDDATNEYNKIREDVTKYNKDIQDEEKSLGDFNDGKNDPNARIVILLGNTGDGKSTFGNRLCGDTSKKSDQGPFKTSAKAKSCTQDLSKQATVINKVKVTVVDAPGWNDSDGKDRMHANNLCKYLRGCGGINQFVLIRNAMNCRFDDNLKQMLKKYETMFGKLFWKHLVVVLTRVDKAYQEEFEECEKDKEMQDQIYNAFKDAQEYDIPVIPVGRDNYLKAIQTLVKSIPAKKFECEHIKSPLNDLKQARDKLLVEAKQAKHKVVDLEKKIQNIQKSIDDLEKQIQNIKRAIAAIN